MGNVRNMKGGWRIEAGSRHSGWEVSAVAWGVLILKGLRGCSTGCISGRCSAHVWLETSSQLADRMAVQNNQRN